MIFQNGHPMIMMIKKLYAVEKIHLLSKWYCILFSQKSSIFYALVCFCVTFCWFLNMYVACYFTSIPITGLQHVSLWLMSSFDPPFSHSTVSRDHVIHIFIENNLGTGITMCLYAHDSVFVKYWNKGRNHIQVHEQLVMKVHNFSISHLSLTSCVYILVMPSQLITQCIMGPENCSMGDIHCWSWKNTSHSNLMEIYLCPCSYCNEIIATDFYLCLCRGTGTSSVFYLTTHPPVPDG